jgi:hypothetical protein
MTQTIEVESIRRLDVKPGETLVFTFPYPHSMKELDELRAKVEANLPAGVKVLFTSPEVELTVVAVAAVSDEEPMRS